MTGIEVKREINTNTIGMLIGFMVTFAAIVGSYTGMQSEQRYFREWMEEHEVHHRDRETSYMGRLAAIDTRLSNHDNSLTALDQVVYRLTLVEKQLENTDSRISRVVESYSNQFTEIRGQLASIATQLALANDALKRVETGGRAQAGR